MAIPDKWKRFLDEVVGVFGPGGPRVRPMVAADLREVLRIVRLHDSDDARAAQDYFAHYKPGVGEYEAVQHFVLEDPTATRRDGGTGRVVGVSGYHIDEGGEAAGIYWLGWTYVNPYFRGRGYGAQLLHVVFEHVRRFGARKLYLTTSSLPKFEAAVGFYQRHGFAEEGRLRDFYCDGEHQLILGVKL